MVACPACAAANPAASKFCSECGAKLGPPITQAREVRKTVTVVFSDVTGSTRLGEQLDPESLRALMGRYFGAMKVVLEGHGGTVEKFIGDAVMAVFGIPVVHEDDALRAVRAAAEMGTALTALNDELSVQRGVTLAVRTGVNTGTVVAGDGSSAQTLVTGDAVNVAARLEQSAAPGEILLGEATARLVRDAVILERVVPLTLKGKSEPVPAFRLVAVTAGADAHVRHFERQIVGRERELTILRGAFERTVAERSCQLFTLLGPAGVGKSRLVAEFLTAVVGQATVLKGRCLPYGKGITYWPLHDVVLAAAGIDETDNAAPSLAKLEALVAGERDGGLIASAVAAAIGLGNASVPQEEIFWAARKLLEGLARDRPLVVLVEDIHWAEPTLLDLLEHIADLTRDAPLLLLCLARPELLDRRTGWGGGKLNATTVLLEPLDAAAAAELIAAVPGGSALTPELRTRIIAAAEGNPLYVEEMLGMLVDEGRLVETDGVWQSRADLAEVHVPPSISALLAARLDALAPQERAIAERAAVVGRVFEQAAVAELATEALRPELGRGLLGLVRKELIRPERSELAAGDAFKFRHLLIRDAAYEALPKSERAELHERFADWLERAAGDRVVEYEEVLGHHLEQAHRCRTELGETGPNVERLAKRAAFALARAGQRAVERDDISTAHGFLERALRLDALPSAERIAALEMTATSLRSLSRFKEAYAAANRMKAEAESAGDRAAVLRATALAYDTLAYEDPSVYRDTTEITDVISELESLGDLRGVAAALDVAASAEGASLRWDGARRAGVRALAAAEGTTDMALRRRVVGSLAFPLQFGPAPVSAAIDLLERVASAERGRLLQAYISSFMASLMYLAGRSAEAEERYAAVRAVADELGNDGLAGTALQSTGLVLVACGAFDHAVPRLLEAIDIANRVGDAYTAPTSAALAALCFFRTPSERDVMPLLAIARTADVSDIGGQAQWRWAWALDALTRGENLEAERLAREAVDLLADAEAPLDQSEADIVLAEVLTADGRSVEARPFLLRARDRFEAKEATAAVTRVDRLLADVAQRS